MKLIELFCLNIVFICFPITLYIIFVTFKKKFKVGEKDIYLELVLYFMLIILIYIYSKYRIIELVCTISIPILLSFLYNKTKTSVSLSIINIMYLYSINSDAILLYISLFLSYYLLYFYYSRRTSSRMFLMNMYLLLSTIFMSIYILIYDEFTIKNIFTYIIYIIMTYIVTILIYKVKTLLKTYKTLNDVSKDRELKTNVCKISHEIKNPLVVIKGYLEILDSKSIVKSKKALLNEVNYALDIINDFKDLNHLCIKKEEFILNDIIKELKYDIIPFYSDKKIKCSYLCSNKIKMYADKKRIKQVLINLVKNSIESLDDNGIITINAYSKKNSTYIKIADNGKGMDKETLNNLFTPFYSKKKSGTGLGLSLSKEIINMHNGTIEYISELNSYTEVKIMIPNNMDNID